MSKRRKYVVTYHLVSVVKVCLCCWPVACVAPLVCSVSVSVSVSLSLSFSLSLSLSPPSPSPSPSPSSSSPPLPSPPPLLPPPPSSSSVRLLPSPDGKDNELRLVWINSHDLQMGRWWCGKARRGLKRTPPFFIPLLPLKGWIPLYSVILGQTDLQRNKGRGGGSRPLRPKICAEGSSASSRIRTAPHRSPQRVRRRAIRHTRSPQRLRRRAQGFARHHSESAPTRPIPVEGSSASSRIRTAPHRSPQRVRRRAIRHARSL